MGNLRTHMLRCFFALLAAVLLAGVCASPFGLAFASSSDLSEYGIEPSGGRQDAAYGQAEAGDAEGEKDAASDEPEASFEDRSESAGASDGLEAADDGLGAVGNAPVDAFALEGGEEDGSADGLLSDGDETRASALVTTFQELSAAVTSQDVDTVVLGGDIAMTGLIAIPATKKELTIDGQGRFTLEQLGTTTLTSAATISPVYTLKNMTIVGRTYYGVVWCTASTGAPSIVLENVSYTGPQLIYNRYGTVSFVGTNNVLIKSNGSNSNTAEEIGEVHGVAVEGALTVESTSVGSAFFWMFGARSEKPFLTIKSGAEAVFRTTANTGRGFFWVEGTTYNVVLDVEDNASLLIDITGYNPLSTAEDHRIDSMHIGKNATAVFNFSGGIALSNALVVDQGAVLRMNYLNKPGTSGSAYAYPLFRFLKAAGGDPVIRIDRAKAVVFAVEPSNRPIFGLAQANSLQFTTTDFNYWPTYAAAAAQEKPARMWSSENSNELLATLDLAAGQDVLKSISSNNENFAAEFDPKAARVIQVGTEPMLLAPDKQWSHLSVATGATEPDARVYVDYGGDDGSEQGFSGQSDEAGRYSVAIDDMAIDLPATLKVTSVHDFIALKKPSDVLEAGAPTADPVLQVVEQGDSFPTDAWSLIANADAGDEGPLQAVLAEVPDTGIVGPTAAKVALTNATGGSSVVTVPVFVTDANTVVDIERNIALRAEDFSFPKSEFPENDVRGFVLNRSHARAWDLLSGEDVSSSIIVADDPLANMAGTQAVALSAKGIERVIAVTIIDEAQWVNIRIPTNMLFGTLDVYEDGKIVSPIYDMENGSDIPVEVSLAGFDVVESDGIDLMSGPEAISGGNDLKLGLDVDGRTAVEYLHPLVGTDPSNGFRMTIAPSSRSTLAFSGTYRGAFLPGVVHRPMYFLVWSFAPVFEGGTNDR